MQAIELNLNKLLFVFRFGRVTTLAEGIERMPRRRDGAGASGYLATSDTVNFRKPTGSAPFSHHRKRAKTMSLKVQRTRRFGGWSNTRRKEYQQRFAMLLEESGFLSPTATDSDPTDESQATFPNGDSPENTANVAHGTCPTCGAALIPHSDSRKPSWHSLVNSTYRPHWYQRF